MHIPPPFSSVDNPFLLTVVAWLVVVVVSGVKLGFRDHSALSYYVSFYQSPAPDI